MRSMRRTRRKINHERLLWCDRFCVLPPLDRRVGHIRHEVVALLWGLQRLHGPSILKDDWIILICLACDESVEIIEAPSGWPAIKWPDDAALPVRRIVVFSEPRRVVAVVLENRAHRCGVTHNHVVVARKPSCPFRQE